MIPARILDALANVKRQLIQWLGTTNNMQRKVQGKIPSREWAGQFCGCLCFLSLSVKTHRRSLPGKSS